MHSSTSKYNAFFPLDSPFGLTVMPAYSSTVCDLIYIHELMTSTLGVFLGVFFVAT